MIDYYEWWDGDLTAILEEIPCSENEEVPWFIKIYESLFKRKILKKTQLFADSKSHVRLLKIDPEEAAEAEKELKDIKEQRKKKKNDMNSLEALILKKKGTQESFLAKS